MKKSVLKKVQLGLQILMVSTLLVGTSTTTALAIENTLSSDTQETSTRTSESSTASSTVKNEQDVVQKPLDETDDLPQKLTILGTSDVHGQLWNWSYEDDKQTPVGLSQVSSIVNSVRSENPNGTILIDNGDMNQGTILTDDLYNKAPLIAQPNPMIKAMNYMNYDAMVLGNHEFNFGLDLIKKLENEAKFPILSANTYVNESNNRFVGGTMKKNIDLNGDGQTDLTVGIIGLTTPQIPLWDGAKVDSLYFNPLQEEAAKAVAELKDETDIIVASIHAGRQNADPAASADQVISNVPGIDAYILGHDHRSFAEKIQGPNGLVPVAGPKDTGTEMIKIDLDIEKNGDQWQVKNSDAAIVSTKTVPADEALKAETKEYHDKTREFISEKIGTATGHFLPAEEIKGIPEAQLRPTAMISLINNVQRQATGAQLAASALFKADSKLNAGDISYSNIFDIYKYPNTLVSVAITGENLLTYMENQADYYNTPGPDDLTISFNEKIRVYNYDIFSGISYKIDISKPHGQRIINPTIDGKPVDLTANYTIAMNNYRYEGLLAQGIVTEEPIKSTDPETLRGLIADYIREKQTLDPTVEIENNWEVIGYHFNKNWRDLAVRLVNDGTLQTEPAADGRTPNVKPITKEDVKNAGYQPESETFTIMHTNDIHGRLEGNGKDVLGMARLKTYKNRMNPDLLIDVGDAFQGLPISNFSKGKDMVKVMNEVGYDAMAVGNHEFDFSLETALDYKDELNFPILSNNTFKDGELVFEPSTVVEKSGEKYAIIGVTTPETATKTHPNNVQGVTFSDPITETKKAINEINNSGEVMTAYVVTGHLGIDETTPHEWRGDTLAEALSKEFPDLNITVLDGHSHTAVDGGKKFGNVIYTQTGNYLNNVGLVDVDLADFTKKTASLTPAQSLADLEENPAVKALVDQARANFEAWGSEVVIENNPYQFNGERDNVRTRETNLGNLIGDAMFAYGQHGFNNQTDFAVTNGGGIRANIEPGKVTLGDVIAVMPFGNSISQINVTGAEVKEMFELSLRSMAQKDENGTILLDDSNQPKLGANGGFLHVSSTIRVHYDSTKKGSLLPADEGNGTDKTLVGERVLQIEVQDRTTGKFAPIDEKATYHMATNDFLAAGGDGYDMLGGEREEGPSLDTVLIDHLKQGTTLRLYDAATTIDLAQYKEAFPGERIISISEAEFNKQNKPGPVPNPDPKDPTKPDEIKVAKPVGKTANYPKMGETIVAYGSLGLLIIGLSSYSFYEYNRKRKIG
ncbi:multifunctional 2',3'-cyclic-nucleotide 2'-phosphodiesterase/5'-nucleotidase/3'-nucleotidase [Enterococcus ureilyticus]|uniref:Multifunctional 2',3'-cyclic-nucleotide 2'-phosphodiesterase/5'-nucleotidase/3'-nucleotidase n=1 Tax=Enterococcus ureilyticus TaxID=1131292 RepID=A0A1E5HEL8_9ENTE|nr:5'-nucleotidase C-terminal domain-containing protein [Enterococcus ureilyticus]MBM7687329.1 2',3'-cyclic-nucleotide 2'-phosphodiesterase (5'-nucleotidase family) [Enterococcus ureilyticus]MBO0447567.1 5'-nucleotidase C-terminal domain-containing protein [Enterococcus ureilyticus]OEG23391.1 multifunctional 2',3'-cyclic-nucleotide 2'-phosphodiesterase/5'-nucleotidase/3'-nucleotidase [Enterococcus ureilyticus]